VFKIAVKGEVPGNSQNRIGDSDIAGLETGVALNHFRVDPGHRGGIPIDQDIAPPVPDIKHLIVGMNPDAGTMALEEVRSA
jgi:hypothetical protein